MPTIVWLQDIAPSQHALVGGKASRLAVLMQAGFSIPPGFCLVTDAYRAHLASLNLAADFRAVAGASSETSSQLGHEIRKAILSQPLADQPRRALLDAWQQLQRLHPGPVAVRSSATAEDLASASYAGQQESVLGVSTGEGITRAVLQCWASVWSDSAIAYRARMGLQDEPPEMALVVQALLVPELSGVAFSRDPDGPDRIAIEATGAPGQSVEAGSPVSRYWASRSDGQEILAPGQDSHDGPRSRLLSSDQVVQVARTSLAVEAHFGHPQDMEWAFAAGTLHILQSRPITAQESGFFTERTPDEHCVWTAGFLNQRFPDPVSPLGWTLVRDLLERLAFRDPLRFLGYRQPESVRLTRLYRGHPYVRMAVLQILYKVFPDNLLPEDASQYFPGGDTALRRQAPYPRSALDPRFLFSMLKHLALHVELWSPWHNYGTWQKFKTGYAGQVQDLADAVGSLPPTTAEPLRIWQHVLRAQALSADVLAIHRWSLTCADLALTLLRRMLRAWQPSEELAQLTAQLTGGLPNASVDLNRAMAALAETQGRDRDDAQARFLQEYGHRSLSLDIYRPTFADDPRQLDSLAPIGRGAAPTVAHATEVRLFTTQRLRDQLGRGLPGAIKRAAFDHVLQLVQQYIPLREEQRLAWQRILAIQRLLFLRLGVAMHENEALEDRHHVFFLSLDELRQWVSGNRAPSELASLAMRRSREFARLEQENRASHENAYPPFLVGDRPLLPTQPEGTCLRGIPISPGLARGRVVVLRSATQLGRVQEGDVLVAPGVDPGWTPVFGSLNALVLEHGGQLSHAAIVAREYGLPAVTGIPGATNLLLEGENVLVDGMLGTVTRLDARAKADHLG